jgi:transketolase
VLTRQGVPTLGDEHITGPDGAARGGYVLRDVSEPQVILIATGSEVHLALEAQGLLADEGIAARVVSMPSWELFDAQPKAYRDSVLPPAVTARVAVEAGATFGWAKYVGLKGAVVGLDRFGASAPWKIVYAKLGLTAEAVAGAATELVEGVA